MELMGLVRWKSEGDHLWLSWWARQRKVLEGLLGCTGLCIAEYQGVCSRVSCVAGCRLPLKAAYGVVGMIPRACEVSMTAMVTGQARRPPPKSPWSGGLIEGFLHRFAWASVLLSMLLVEMATIRNCITRGKRL